MQVKAKRNSAIELLRILCMVFIIMNHYVTQVDWGTWGVSNYSFNVLFLQVMTIGGSAANNIFMLITGYYMIGSRVNYKKIVILLGELFFYSWVIAAVLFGTHIVPFSIKEAIRAAVPIWFGYNWYVCCYIIFCCFVPFLNKFLISIDQKTYLRLLLISLGIWSFAYTFKATTYLGTNFSIDHFAIIYLLGGYIKLYGIKIGRIKNWWKVFFLLLSLLILSVVALGLGGYLLKWDILIANAIYFSITTSILDVMVATALFLAVVNMRGFYSRIINIIASSVVGIYLIHHNPLLKQVFWDIVSPNVEYLNSLFLPLHMLLKVTAVFFFCLAVDQLRKLLFEKPFARWLDKRWDGFTAAGKKQIGRFDLLS